MTVIVPVVGTQSCVDTFHGFAEHTDQLGFASFNCMECAVAKDSMQQLG